MRKLTQCKTTTLFGTKRIEEHEARKAALAERMAAIAAEKVAIAKDEASMEAYEAEFLNGPSWRTGTV